MFPTFAQPNHFSIVMVDLNYKATRDGAELCMNLERHKSWNYYSVGDTAIDGINFHNFQWLIRIMNDKICMFWTLLLMQWGLKVHFLSCPSIKYAS